MTSQILGDDMPCPNALEDRRCGAEEFIRFFERNASQLTLKDLEIELGAEGVAEPHEETILER